MCGMCGMAIPRASKRTIDRALLVRMRDTLLHRGPDGAGLYVDDSVGLGHRRLSIVDVAHGAQPMASADENLQIIYNGEVFNHPSLMAELTASGVTYHTHCDTESVLHVYEREGVRTPERLRGMFAFAIWDRRKRELFLARDRFGVKPLYYVLADDGTLFFASEIKALVAAGAVRPALNVAALPDYLANHAPSGEETLFSGVKRLLPGCSLTWREGTVEIRQYWDLHFVPTGADRTERQLVDEYHERLREAVRLRLMADVPLGAFLSGGIDSAAITALMSELVAEPVKTFSVAFAEREANELAYARMVATRFGTDHHEIVVSAEDFFGALPSMVWHEDEPLAHPSSIALNFVSRLASRHVKVVLTGEGSDETLAGYDRYRKTVYNLALGERYERAVPRAVRESLRRAIGSLPRGSRARQKLSRTFLALDANIPAIYNDNFAVFGRRDQVSLLSPAMRARLGEFDPYAAISRWMAGSDATSVLDRLLYADTKTYLAELLMKQDQMSMAASIESRVPFLDHPLVEFAAGLPERMKLRGLTTKYILRAAMRQTLPAEILERPKMGFPVPIASWFRGAHAGVIDELVLGDRAADRGLFDRAVVSGIAARHRAGVQNHAQQLWSLANLELWHRIFVDDEPVDQIRLTPGRARLERSPPEPAASPAKQ